MLFSDPLIGVGWCRMHGFLMPSFLLANMLSYGIAPSITLSRMLRLSVCILATPVAFAAVGLGRVREIGVGVRWLPPLSIAGEGIIISI